MPLIARGDKTADVACDHGNPMPSIPTPCGTPSKQKSDICSPNVFVEGVGVVRNGDAMVSHPTAPCPPHAPLCDTYSPNVFANGKEIGRVGDTYAGPGTHVITDVAQSTVTAN
jgi:uncharacterized Zn-binding protein involved in type VI secretion